MCLYVPVSRQSSVTLWISRSVRLQYMDAWHAVPVRPQRPPAVYECMARCSCPSTASACSIWMHGRLFLSVLTRVLMLYMHHNLMAWCIMSWSAWLAHELARTWASTHSSPCVGVCSIQSIARHAHSVAHVCAQIYAWSCSSVAWSIITSVGHARAFDCSKEELLLSTTHLTW